MAAFTRCVKKSPEPDTPQPESEVTEPAESGDTGEEEPSAEPAEGDKTPSGTVKNRNINYLTGETATGDNTFRPIAVMISNAKINLPQSGLTDADIIYEAVTEGGVTRMMAVYSDINSIKRSGSIRSARDQFIELMLPLNAIYIHIGTSTSAKRMLDFYSYNDIDGIYLGFLAFQYDTEMAKITVNTDATAGAPKVTKSPTDETVKPGEGAWFVAKHEGAIWAEWHVVSPDGKRDLNYADAGKEFPALQIINGDKPTLQLKSIPAELNGWKVYCAFRNNMGTTNTGSATITVTGGNVTPTPTAQPQGFEGRWAGENNARCVVNMTYKSEGCQSVDITWSGGAALKSRWTMTANVTRNDIMEYTDGHYWIQEFINDTEYNVKDEEFNQTGRFFMQDGKLHWVNDRTGEEVILIRA